VIRAAQIVIKDALRHDGAPRSEHLMLVTTDGRVFERFSDDDPGAWTEVPLPKSQAKRKARKAR
jgi:hypothetical protein